MEESLEKRKHERPWKLKQGEAIRSAVQGAGKWFRLQVAHCGAFEGGELAISKWPEFDFGPTRRLFGDQSESQERCLDPECRPRSQAVTTSC